MRLLGALQLLRKSAGPGPGAGAPCRCATHANEPDSRGLLVARAAHAVRAGPLYATPPPGTGFATADLRTGAVPIYYGGHLVEIGLATVPATQWYTSTGRGLCLRRRATVAGC
ncbi:hypothetical protein GCM10010381_39540 [Streptomyces xantholiticus]|nr:hypothetical protein GCM10010381_39540 [Streptomyces xantholiticus]